MTSGKQAIENGLLWLSRVFSLTREELREQGITVFEAPDVPADQVVVNLMNGVVVEFAIEGEMPDEGFYARREELIRLAEARGLELNEQNRTLMAVPKHALQAQVAGDGDADQPGARRLDSG
ncbi:MAG TPA: hypothetical protein VFB34_05005 [Chloroflexota bacterium]|nr:hypothetical protein [Chloroflexota bacterium]